MPPTESPDGFLEQLVRDRAEERSRPEREDEPLDALRDVGEERHDRADEERGRAQPAPEQGLDHRMPRSRWNCQVMS